MKAVLLRHNEIDKAAWDDCLLKSNNALAYAHSSWLDGMCPQWQAIVWGDYEVIMPLPVRRKFGLQYLFVPAFTQQLGLFSAHKISQHLINESITKVQQNFRYADLLFNYANPSSGFQARNNLVLHLNVGLDALSAAFKPDLVKNLKRAEKFSMHYAASQNVGEALMLYQEQYAGKMGLKPGDFTAFKNLMEDWQKKGWCLTRTVKSNNGALLACGVFAWFDKRIYNLASTTLPNGRMMEANHYLFHQLLLEFAGKARLLDFEGSDLPGIARFYQKFGAESQPYFVHTINRLPAILRWLKR